MLGAVPAGDRRVQVQYGGGGWPLRTETFYYSHRKGGPQVLPVDVPAFLRSLLPRPTDDDYRYLTEHSYEMGPGFKAAIVQTDALEVRALPRGAVFYDREPVFTVTGPAPVDPKYSLEFGAETQALQTKLRIRDS